jgi:hypothetical protein
MGAIKTKITTGVVIPVFGENQALGSGFAHRLDALGAQNLVDLVTLFHHNRLLQVGPEGTIGGALRKGAVMPEGGGLSAVCTFSHYEELPFLL